MGRSRVFPAFIHVTIFTAARFTTRVYAYLYYIHIACTIYNTYSFSIFYRVLFSTLSAIIYLFSPRAPARYLLNIGRKYNGDYVAY